MPGPLNIQHQSTSINANVESASRERERERESCRMCDRLGDARRSSGLRKFGAIIGESSQLGCNAVTNPGVVLGPRCMIMPNSTITGIHDSDSTIR